MPKSPREANKRVASLCEETSPVPKPALCQNPREANKRVVSLCEETSPVPKMGLHQLYTLQRIVCLHRKYAAEHGPAKASRHFSSLFERPVPESTARLLKKQYLMEFEEQTQGWGHTGGEKVFQRKCVAVPFCQLTRIIGLFLSKA